MLGPGQLSRKLWRWSAGRSASRKPNWLSLAATRIRPFSTGRCLSDSRRLTARSESGSQDRPQTASVGQATTPAARSSFFFCSFVKSYFLLFFLLSFHSVLYFCKPFSLSLYLSFLKFYSHKLYSMFFICYLPRSSLRLFLSLSLCLCLVTCLYFCLYPSVYSAPFFFSFPPRHSTFSASSSSSSFTCFVCFYFFHVNHFFFISLVSSYFQYSFLFFCLFVCVCACACACVRAIPLDGIRN